ncbi:uncharacterized protein PpBr36_05886 [Pyricularia pennisetigena]|uniref:uncharacterized protein n=1 Tax=Pyricularia pennisetigena TaxID=1578925 RepID=UPI001153E40D|nr:uncharacterized protein PpBr36_05886 [Pyricularia pennisetigena]TLS23200.1 hypothetical protein PpBr36_05886 [Pyricularia pennisetigena]
MAATMKAATMEPAGFSAADIWKSAQKCRRTLQKRLEQLHQNEGKGNEDAYLRALDEILCTFRLGCVGTVFEDFAYATEQNVDKHLWNMHSTINGEFRRVRSRLNPKAEPKVAILHRQVLKMQGDFLRTSQKFYKGYLQRLSAKYHIPNLDRVVKSVRFDVTLDKVDRESNAGLESQIVRACHQILVHLGDLARYRLEVDRKPQKTDIPLLYLRLANDLLPSSGLGYHQMAVVYRGIKDQDLAIVYHLHRALVVQEPHPMAAKNLEIEFQKLSPGSPMRGRNSSLDPQITLSVWFVRLHAIYYAGLVVAQQKELEREVLHRVQMLLVTKDTVGLLLTLVLTSIAAYDFALQRTEEKWSEEASQSCQFILGFNIRIILAVNRVLAKQIQEVLQSVTPAPAAGETSTPVAAKATDKFLTVLQSALPLLRVYMVWLCKYRGDVVRYASHLSHVTEMHQSMAETISLLIEVFRGDQNDGSTAKYMLFEDVETLGFQPLENDKAPFVCRPMHFFPDGTAKPRVEDCSFDKVDNNGETISRINDIVNCGYFIGTDPNYPLTISRKQKGPRTITILSYQAGSDSDIIPGMNNSSSACQSEPVTPHRQSAQASPAPNKLTSTNGTHQHPQPPQAPIGTPNGTMTKSTETEFDVDEEMLGRLNEFLAPPEVHSPQQQNGTEDPTFSYGMHSITANDVFGALNSQKPVKTPTSASGRAFPTLPWDMWTPTNRSGFGFSAAASPEVEAATAFSQAAHYSHAPRNTERLQSPGLPSAPRASDTADAQAQVAAERYAAGSFPNRDPSMGKAYSKERMDEISKQASWQFNQKRQPARVATSSIPAQTPVRQPYNQPAGFIDSPFFQSTNFSSSASGLSQVQGSWGQRFAVPGKKPS